MHTMIHEVPEIRSQDGDLGDGEATVILTTMKDAEHKARASNCIREWGETWMA